MEDITGCKDVPDYDKENPKVSCAINTSAVAGVCDDIVRDILSRLPVKSLMRFKLVCKHWTSLIRHDSFFIDLHFSRSKERSSDVSNLLFVTRRLMPVVRSTDNNKIAVGHDLNMVDISATDKYQDNKLPVVASHHHNCNVPDFWSMSRPVNGLICFAQTHRGYIRVVNIATGEGTPWIKATLKDSEGRNYYYKKQYKCRWRSAFGFDPCTKNHKVICLYEKSRILCDYDEYERLRDTDEVDEVCEVMTLENNNNSSHTWRRIDDYPQYRIDDLPDVCVYSKGSVYWIGKGHMCSARWKQKNPGYEAPLDPYSEGMALIAFDVGSEKFRTIELPPYIVFSPESRDSFIQNSSLCLFEVSGHIALIDPYYRNMWLFMDDHSHGSKETTSSGRWIKESLERIKIKLPPKSYWYSFEDAVPGTDEIILRVRDFHRIPEFFICYYNWRTKTVHNIIEISNGENLVGYLRKVTFFIESLLSF